MKELIIKSVILSRNHVNGQQIVAQSCMRFLDLFDRAQFGYRVNPLDDPYSITDNSDANQQYQRRIDKKRVGSIKEFIRTSVLKNRNNTSLSVIFPTAMLVAFNYDDDLTDTEGIIECKVPETVHIVDGQHRLWSMHELYKDVCNATDEDSKYIKEYLEEYLFNCTVFVNFDMWEQARIFANVNFNQKAVSKSLYYDIYGMEYYGDARDEQKNAMYIAHQIIDELNTNSFSSLKGYIKMLGTGRGYVSQSCFADSIIPNITSVQGEWYIDFDQYKNDEVPSYHGMLVEVMNFFNAVAEVFPKLWPKRGEKPNSILCKTTGIQVLVRTMGYLHRRNRNKIESWIDSVPEGSYVCQPYFDYIKDVLQLFTKDQVNLFGLVNNGGSYSGTGGKGLVNKLYSVLIQRIERKESQKYIDWIEECLDDTDFENVYDLFCSVETIDSYGQFTTREKKESYTVEALDIEYILILDDESDRQNFLRFLDDKYGEEIGIEALYSFKREMEKDD